MRDRLAGGSYSPDDESGDAHRFSRELAGLCSSRGVRFRFGLTARSLVTGKKRHITGVGVLGEDVDEVIAADACVVCLGTGSSALLQPLDIRLRIAGTAEFNGYDLTLNNTCGNAILRRVA